MKRTTCTPVWACLLLLPFLVGWPRQVSMAAEPAAGPTQPVQPKEETIQLEPIVVTATRTKLELKNAPVSVTILNKEDLAQGGALSVDDALRQIPGFNTFRRSSSLVTAPAQDPEAQGVTLRGVGPGGASRALVLVDGIPMNDAFGGWIYWGELPLESIERIEVVQGGSSNLWGDFAMSGVINIITTSPEKRGVETKASGGNRDTVDGWVSYTDVVSPVRFNLQGEFFHTGGWNIVAPSQRGPIDQNADSEHGTFIGQVEYAPTSDVSLFLRGSFYDESRNTGTPFRTSDTTRGFIAGGGKMLGGDGSEWQLTIFSHLSTFNEHFSEVSDDRTSEIPEQLQEVPSTDVGGALTWTRPFADHLLLAGSDFRLINGESQDAFYDPTGTFIADQQVSGGNQTFVSFFLQDIYTPMPALQVSLGLRVDYYRSYNGSVVNTPTGMPTVVTQFPDKSEVVLSPKLAIRYELLDGLAVLGSAYRSFRAPTLSELYRRSSVEGLVLLQNPDLDPEFLVGGEGGFEYTGLPGLRASVTGYYNSLDNPIASVTTARDPVTGVVTERTRMNLGGAQIWGIQADAEFQMTPQWNVVGRYLYSDATVTDNPDEPDLVGKRLTQVPFNSWTLGVRYTNPNLFTLWVGCRYEGHKFEDADNLEKLDSYYLVDLNLSRSIPRLDFLPWLQGGEVFLAIQNLFDRQYDVDLGGGILKIGTPFLIQGGLRLQF